MKAATLDDLQASVQDPAAVATLADYLKVTEAFLNLVQSAPAQPASCRHHTETTSFTSMAKTMGSTRSHAP